MNNDDKIVYMTGPKDTLTVGQVIEKLSKMDKSLPLWVDTEARCDQAHLYPVEGAWDDVIDDGLGRRAVLTLHI